MGIEVRKHVFGVNVQIKDKDASVQSDQDRRFLLNGKYRIYTCYERNSNIQVDFVVEHAGL